MARDNCHIQASYNNINMKVISDDLIVLTNIVTGESIEINDDTLQLISFFLMPKTFQECCEEYSISEDSVEEILQPLFESGILNKGIDEGTKITSNFADTESRHTFFDSDKKEDECNQIAILGVPYDGAVTGIPGCKLGVKKLRDITSGYIKRYTRIDNKIEEYKPPMEIYEDNLVCDLGDVLYLPGEASYDLHQRLERVYRANMSNSQNKIVVIGGDHSITYPILKSFDTPIIFIKIDAHYDCNPINNNLINHCNFVNEVYKLDNVIDTIHVGAREASNLNSDSCKVITMNDIENNLYEELFSKYLESTSDIYLSIDIDALDPSIAPGTGYTIPFGMSMESMLNIIKELSKYNIVGCDIVEFNPLIDKNNVTLYNVAKILKFIIEKNILKNK